MATRHCCFIPCDKPAEFEITDEGEPMIYDAQTDACEEHVGALIGSVAPTEPKGPWTVRPINQLAPA